MQMYPNPNINYMPDVNQYNNYAPVYYDQTVNTAYMNNQQYYEEG